LISSLLAPFLAGDFGVLIHSCDPCTVTPMRAEPRQEDMMGRSDGSGSDSEGNSHGGGGG
jgi:hypothetical protein